VGTKRCRTFNLDELVQLSDGKKLRPAASRERKPARKRPAR